MGGTALTLEATIANGRIVMGGLNGVITLSVNAASTTSLLGTYTWDLEVTFPTGVVRTVSSGRLLVAADTTYG